MIGAGSRRTFGSDAFAEAIAVAERVFEVAHWHSRELDHLALVGRDADAAFADHSRLLSERWGGYQCAGMATYLLRALEHHGFRGFTYNAGLPPFTHVVTVVEVGGDLAIVDAFAGAIGRRFIDVLRAGFNGRPIHWNAVMPLLARNLRKEYFCQLPERGETGNAAASGFEVPGRIVSRAADGTLHVDPDGEWRDFIDCTVSPTGLLRCSRPPGHDVYEYLDGQLAARTGVRSALLLMPLNLHGDNMDDFVARYPWVRTLLESSSRFREATVASGDPAQHAALIRHVQDELSSAFGEAARP